MKYCRHNWDGNFLTVYDDKRIDAPSPEATSMSSLDLDGILKRHDVNDNVLSYPLRFKMALPYVVKGPVIMCDDDMLLQRCPRYLGLNWASSSGLNRLTWSDTNIVMCDLISDATGFDWDPDIHQQWQCDAGVYCFDADTKHTFLSVMRMIFKHPRFPEMWSMLSKSSARVFDQQVLSLTAKIRNFKLLKSTADYSFVPYKYPSKYCRKLPKSTFVHYCATSHKANWMRFFIDELEAAKIPSYTN